MRLFSAVILAAILILGGGAPAIAGGVAAQQQRGIRARRIIVPHDEKGSSYPKFPGEVPDPSRSPAQGPEPELAPEPEPQVAPKPQPAPKARSVYKPSNVLVSSPAAPTGAAPVGGPVTESPSAGMSGDMAAIIQQFDQASVMWPRITDMRAKMLIVAYYVDLYRQFNIHINKPPMFYVQVIDSMSQQNPQILQYPFDQLLRVASIIEYDYDDGQNKDTLARSILDENAFIQNKRRLGLQ